MRPKAPLLVVLLLFSACSGGTKATNCDEYAAELRQVIDSTTTADEIQDFLNDTESDVAELIIQSRADPSAQACADAVLEAMFIMADRGFSQIGD